jgi:hypothetical protein
MTYSFTRWPTPEEIGMTDPRQCDTWHERVAIATIDGGVDEQTARAMAWREVGQMDNHRGAQLETPGLFHERLDGLQHAPGSQP